MERKYHNAASPCTQAEYFFDMADYRDYWFKFATGDIDDRELDELELYAIEKMGGYSGGEFWMIVYLGGNDIFGTDLELLLEQMESEYSKSIAA